MIFLWAEEALRGREATDLHLLYHMMGFVPATVTTTGNFIQYIRMIGEFHTDHLLEFISNPVGVK
ncbi:hypothetical protein BDC45DRAFT_552645 [Circinella umbellata]|nr:hypothetical protein BDC45DRAFT_552645 [Circinella umbellata]